MFAVQLKHEIEQMFSAYCRAGQGSGDQGGNKGMEECISVCVCGTYVFAFV